MGVGDGIEMGGDGVVGEMGWGWNRDEMGLGMEWGWDGGGDGME